MSLSDDTLGIVLLVAAVVPGILGWDLSRRGIAKVNVAADAATNAANSAKQLAADIQRRVTTAATGTEAASAAQQSNEVADKADAVGDAIADVRAALEGMTGIFAPARVFLAIAVLLVVGALFALDVIQVSA